MEASIGHRVARTRKKALLFLLLLAISVVLSFNTHNMTLSAVPTAKMSLVYKKALLSIQENIMKEQNIFKMHKEVQLSINISQIETFEMSLDSSKVTLSNTVEVIPIIPPPATLVNTDNDSMPYKETLNPNLHIECLETLAAPYLAKIQNIRERILAKESFTKEPFPSVTLKKRRKFLDATESTFFSDLATYDQVQTFYFNASMGKVKSCLIKEYYPFYSINNCSRVLALAKRHEQYGRSLYSQVCSEIPTLSLDPYPLQPSVFEVSLPRAYQQGVNMKTVSYIHVVRNGIVTAFGDIHTEKMDIIPHRCYPNRHQKLPISLAKLPLIKEAFTIAQYFGDGMFHGNVEALSRIALYVPFLKANSDISIHVNDKVPIFMEFFGFPSSRFVSGIIRAKVLYAPAGTGCCLPNLITTQLESFYLRRSLPNIWHERDAIILVKRTPHRNRYFEQHNAILDMLRSVAQEHDLQVWEFSDNPVPPVREVAAMFNRAVMVVAPHGAGETNLLFSQPGLVLIEGLCFDDSDGRVNLVYRNMVHLIGGHYYGFYKTDKHCVYITADDLKAPVSFYLQSMYNLENVSL